MQNLTPRQIVDELDRYIIGQSQAKRAVAVAIRNRWRRRQLDDDLSRGGGLPGASSQVASRYEATRGWGYDDKIGQ